MIASGLCTRHVRMVAEAPALKEGTGPELCKLHDTVQWHLRALKATKHEPPGAFITSSLKLKLDATTMFEWQRASQEQMDVPHYADLLSFLDLHAQGSEGQSVSSQRKPRTEHWRNTSGSSVFAFVSSVSGACIVCEVAKHPLYSCPTFCLMSHGGMVSLLKSHNLCMNCMKSGHFVCLCPSLSRCCCCQGPQHTFLHTESTGHSPVNPFKFYTFHCGQQ